MAEFNYTFDLFLTKDSDATSVDLREMDAEFLERMIQEAATAADRPMVQAAAAVLHGIEPIFVAGPGYLAEMMGSEATTEEAETLTEVLTEGGLLVDHWLVADDRQWEDAMSDAEYRVDITDGDGPGTKTVDLRDLGGAELEELLTAANGRRDRALADKIRTII